jgi:sulfate adenylyltransferase (ADP) / ATP adenylyltransferase
MLYSLYLTLLKQLQADGKPKMLLQKGTLWKCITATAKRALASGALLPAPTEYSFLEDGGIRFFVRVLAGLQRKDEAREKQKDAGREKQANPFLPPEKDLTVADISDTHIAILNKYNVVDHHILIVTRRFENQELLLTVHDFEALWTCMAEFNCLGFYNGGREAGASQQHKHLQIVPLPLAPEGPSVPIEPLLVPAGRNDVGTIPGYRFLHAFQRLGTELVRSPNLAAKKTFDFYSTMIKSVGMTPPAADREVLQTLPYCFLMTRDWMLLVPRSKEFMEGISINSLAFAGSFFVRSEKQLERLKSFGPLRALQSVAIPKKQTA